MSEYVTNPVVPHRADPWCFKHSDGFYYFTGSVPAYDRIEILKASTVQGLAFAEPVVAWRKHERGPMSWHIWAPEIHHVDGKWVIYFAAGRAEAIWDIRIYVLENESPDPTQGTWTEKGRVETPWDTFSLDATTFAHRGRRYLVWAQKDPEIDGNTNLYIAAMANPWTIEGTPQRLTRPEFPWECEGFLVNEGPAVLHKNGRLFLTYSGSATDHRYRMGLLTANEDADLLDPASWTKSPEPVFASSDENGQYGPGHSCFTTSTDGTIDLLMYHARPYRDTEGDPLYDPNRNTRVQRIEWADDGSPIFGEPVRDGVHFIQQSDDHKSNWAGNLHYQALRWNFPATAVHIQEQARRSTRIKAIGSRHSFNDIADTTGDLFALPHLSRIVDLDRKRRTVTIEGGVRYGELARYLHADGFALHNLASLPHISVAGACATATHGSGSGNGCLAIAVRALEMVTGDGQLVTLSRETDGDTFAGAVVGLGALGIVTQLTLAIEPTFNVAQVVYENLPLDALESDFDAIFASAYSVSLFTDWGGPRFNQVWLKFRDAAEIRPEFFGATPAPENRHPIPGISAVNCTEQMGVPGPWHERLPHFRLDFTPSNGAELQSEYLLPREHAFAALTALNAMRDEIAALLQISEIRTIAADDLWMSPFRGQNSVALHFTWKPDWPAVRALLPKIEARLAPFDARPHWGKLFTMEPDRLRSLFPRLPDFRALAARFDPNGKMRNDFLNRWLV